MSKVAHVTPWGVQCGVAKHLSNWLPYLEREIIVLAENPPKGWGYTVEEWSGPPVDRCWSRGQRDTMPSIMDAVQRHDASLVHAQFDPSFFPYRQMIEARSSWQGVKLIFTVHVLEDHEPFTKHNKALCRMADQIVCGTASMARAWTEFAGRYHIALKNPIKVIPLPITPPPERVRTEPRRHDAPVILTWGMLGGLKGHKEVYDAVCGLRQNGYADAKYVVAGAALTGEQRNHAQALREMETGSDGAMQFLEGWIPDGKLYPLLQNADVIVLNHNWKHESSSGTVTWSVASGTPVVVSESPMFDGYENAVVHSESGKLEQAIDKVLRGDVLDLEREEAVARAMPKAIAAEYEGIYQKLEGGRPAMAIQVRDPVEDALVSAIKIILAKWNANLMPDNAWEASEFLNDLNSCMALVQAIKDRKPCV